LEARDISGGAGTLSVQASCPLRAFIQSRLKARPLEPVTRGLNPRQRGIVAHRALELFMRRLPGQADLAEWESDTQQAWATDCAERALQETFGSARTLLPVVYRLEYERLLSTIASLLDNDLKRGEFRVKAVEERQVAEMNGYRLSCRLDRIDTLADGGVAVIDYKTGNSASTADWFKERLRDTQLPLYTQIVGGDVRATVIAAVHSDGVQFRGVWAPKDEFHGRLAKLPEKRDWPAQLTLWRQQLETLIAEYVDGDTRILMQDLEAARGSFAPLTRVIEQLAILRFRTVRRDGA
jgi:RecB family exonuclease